MREAGGVSSCSGSCSYAPPSVHIAQPRAGDSAEGVARVAALAGLHLLDWQVDVLRDFSAVDARGQFVHRRCGGSIPCQVGKSVVGEAWVIPLVLNGYRVLWTDHNYSTTSEMRRRFQEVFGRRPADPNARHPEFNALVSAVNNSTGQEAIEFSTGGVLCFSTRTKSATLGYSFDVIVYDEAQELTDEQQQAILPTFTSGAMHNPQALFLGTPTRPGSFGTVFGRMREGVLADRRLSGDACWWEWGVAEVGDVLDEERWAGVNPSLGKVANLEAIRTATTLMDDLAFAQEFLGYWLPKGRSAVPEIGEDAWRALETAAPPKEGKRVLAFKFAPDGSEGVVAACVRPPGGTPHVECVAIRSMAGGMAWFEEFAASRAGRYAGFVIDGGGNAQELNDRLLAARVPRRAIARPTTAQVCAACAGLLADVADGGFTHFGQPDLDRAATSAKKRPIGKSGFGFEGIDGADALPLEAAALALWGIDEIKRDPTRKLRVG